MVARSDTTSRRRPSTLAGRTARGSHASSLVPIRWREVAGTRYYKITALCHGSFSVIITNLVAEGSGYPTFRTSPFHFSRISLGWRDGWESWTTSVGRP